MKRRNCEDIDGTARTMLDGTTGLQVQCAGGGWPRATGFLAVSPGLLLLLRCTSSPPPCFASVKGPVRPRLATLAFGLPGRRRIESYPYKPCVQQDNVN
jgi:hypothetical protein